MESDWRDFNHRYDGLISDYNEFKKALDKPFPVYLRPNLKRISLSKFCDYLKSHYPKSLPSIPYDDLPIIQVKGERSFWGGRLEHHTGLYFMQAVSSLIPVMALDLKPDDVVIDMCAAPGGKTTDMATYLDGKGIVYANEPNIGRGRVLKANIDRMGLENVVVMQEWGEKLNLSPGIADKVLLDGPCSSEGTLRENVHKKRFTQYNESFRTKLQKTQRELLDKSFELLKPGGTLVYSTCTYDPDENEKQVQWFLDKYKKMELAPFELNLPLRDGEYGLNYSKRVFPQDINSIGFYVAKLLKY